MSTATSLSDKPSANMISVMLPPAEITRCLGSESALCTLSIEIHRVNKSKAGLNEGAINRIGIELNISGIFSRIAGPCLLDRCVYKCKC